MEHYVRRTLHPYSDMFWNGIIRIINQYVRDNPKSPKTQLFSLLALLKVYVPESYLLMPECQRILGPPDFIYGGPPFQKRMEPFSVLITTSNRCRVRMIDLTLAQRAVELLASLRIYRSATLRKFMCLLCGDQAQEYVMNFIKDLLTKREMGEKGKEKFSRLIEDIVKNEDFKYAVSVLTVASDKFSQIFIFPQTLSRLYYIKKWTPDYERAEEWAKRAIQRAPRNSYVADTLGQIYKNRLRKANQQQDILNMAKKAFEAFKDVEVKAEREVDPEMRDIAGIEDTLKSFNNRGFFGFIQVAKIVFEKLSEQQRTSLVQNKKMEVEDKFDFFEWYLTYSRPDMETLEPDYFWRDVAVCYKHYTTETAAESTSFPGLLDCLNHGLFTSRGKRAGFEEDEKTVSDLEEIQDLLKTTYEENTDDVNVAERYILSNIILSNRTPDSPQLTPVNELQRITHRFLGSPEGHKSPEFYLLVLLLFWPEEQPQVVQEEDDEKVEQEATGDDGSEEKTWEDEDSNEESETEGEPAQLPHDLQQYVTFMERAYDRGSYAKYLRGRYLLPLFFLGKGSGLSKWIHKSKLDAIVEKMVDAEQPQSNKDKVMWIKNMWISGKVWQIPEIQEILLPVRVEPCHTSIMSQEHEEMFVCVGGKKIKASVEDEPSVLSPIRFYLGFTIRGPVLFKVPHMSGQ